MTVSYARNAFFRVGRGLALAAVVLFYSKEWFLRDGSIFAAEITGKNPF